MLLPSSALESTILGRLLNLSLLHFLCGYGIKARVNNTLFTELYLVLRKKLRNY